MFFCDALVFSEEGTYLSFFFFSSRRRHTRFDCDWSSDVCSSDLERQEAEDDRGDTAKGQSPPVPCQRVDIHVTVSSPLRRSSHDHHSQHRRSRLPLSAHYAHSPPEPPRDPRAMDHAAYRESLPRPLGPRPGSPSNRFVDLHLSCSFGLDGAVPSLVRVEEPVRVDALDVRWQDASQGRT